MTIIREEILEGVENLKKIHEKLVRIAFRLDNPLCHDLIKLALLLHEEILVLEQVGNSI